MILLDKRNNIPKSSSLSCSMVANIVLDLISEGPNSSFSTSKEDSVENLAIGSCTTTKTKTYLTPLNREAGLLIMQF